MNEDRKRGPLVGGNVLAGTPQKLASLLEPGVAAASLSWLEERSWRASRVAKGSPASTPLPTRRTAVRIDGTKRSVAGTGAVPGADRGVRSGTQSKETAGQEWLRQLLAGRDGARVHGRSPRLASDTAPRVARSPWPRWYARTQWQTREKARRGRNQLTPNRRATPSSRQRRRVQPSASKRWACAIVARASSAT